MKIMKIFRNPEFKKVFVILVALTVFLPILFLLSGLKAAVAALICCLIFDAISFFFLSKRYENLESLILAMDVALSGKEMIKINEATEGEISILQTEIEKLFSVLQFQNEELKKEREYLSDSIADISHQLRTPLTSINLVITLLRSEDIDLNRRFELLNELTRLVDKTDRLITTLLKLSKIDAGTVEFEKETVSVKSLCEKAFSPLAIQFDIKGQSFEVICKNEAFSGDMMWSVEALSNIIKNCSEHTSVGGKIKISAEETPLFCEMIIEDDGSGFNEEDIPFLFERFYKGKNSSADSFGIGLALAKSIINAQNGVITAKNKTDGGASFTIRFYKTTV